MVEIRYPSITGVTEKEQLSEIRSYLYQLADALQVALSQAERKAPMQEKKPSVSKSESGELSPVARFNSIKALIIKSADIVQAYYETIDNLIATSGKYVAQSVFGTYTEDVAQQLSASTDQIRQNISRVESISSSLTGLRVQMGDVEKNFSGSISNVNSRVGAMEKDTADSLSEISSRVGNVEQGVDQVGNWFKTQQAYIHYGAVGTTLDDTGLAADNAPGIEIGDYQVLSDGQSVAANRRFARFTAYGLELFGDSRDASPVAYIKQNKLYITNAEITSSLKLGGFMINKFDGLSFDWVGV